MIASAVVFLVLLFFIKNKSLFTNIVNYTSQRSNQESLTYNDEIIADLVNRDTDKDGVLDWEEGLWSTDPTKKDTNDDGVQDNVEIEKLKKQTRQNEQGLPLHAGENLTETDKFSRELFATVATLNQTGQIDQVTVEKLSSSLADKIQNSAPRKVFTVFDIKTINDDTKQTIQKYSDILSNLYPKTPAKYSVLEVLQKFVLDENEGNAGNLSLLDPIIERANNLTNGMLKMEVPKSLVLLHLNLINSFERILENLNDIKLYETDTILSLAGISQYEENAIALESAANQLTETIKQKLNN